MCRKSFDYSKLKGRIKEMFDTQGKFADAVGRSPAFVSLVMNNNSDLSQSDIEVWAEKLGISPGEYADFFFAKEVCEKETCEVMADV